MNYHEVASLFRAQRDADTLNSVSPVRAVQTQRVEWLALHFNGGASESAGDDRNCPGFSSERHRSVPLIFNERDPACATIPRDFVSAPGPIIALAPTDITETRLQSRYRATLIFPSAIQPGLISLEALCLDQDLRVRNEVGPPDSSGGNAVSGRRGDSSPQVFMCIYIFIRLHRKFGALASKGRFHRSLERRREDCLDNSTVRTSASPEPCNDFESTPVGFARVIRRSKSRGK